MRISPESFAAFTLFFDEVMDAIDICYKPLIGQISRFTGKPVFRPGEVVAVYAKMGRVDEAMALLPGAWDGGGLWSLAEHVLRGGHAEKAHALLIRGERDRITTPANPERFTSDMLFYARAFVETGDPDSARRVLDTVLVRGVPPAGENYGFISQHLALHTPRATFDVANIVGVDSGTMLAIADAALRVGDFALFETIVALPLVQRDLPRHRRHFTWDHVVRGDFPAALRSVNDIPGLRDRATALEHIAITQIKNSDIGGGRATLEHLVTLSKRADTQDEQDALRAVANVQSFLNDIIAAQKTVARMIPEGEEYAQAAAAIAQAHARQGDIAGAMETLDTIPDGEEKRDVIPPIARARAAAGDTSGAIRLLQGVGDGEFAEENLTQIAVLRAADGDADGAFAAANAIPVERSRGTAWNAIERNRAMGAVGVAHLRRGEKEAGLAVLREAHAILGTIPTVDDETPILSRTYLINTCFEAAGIVELPAGYRIAD